MQNKILGLLATFFLLSFTSGHAQSIITVPPALNPGDQYRLAFVTRDEIFTATSATITDYDESVTSQANISSELAALGTTWRVIGSTEGYDAKTHTNTDPSVDGVGVPIYRLDGQIIAIDYANLWDGDIDNSLSMTPGGNYVAIGGSFTGTRTDGTAASGEALGASLVVDGAVEGTAENWVETSAFTSTSPQYLYGISDILTAPGELTIDIESGKQTTCRGTISVVIFGGIDLDVTQIDQTTLSFDGLDVGEKRNGALFCSATDTDSDGYLDLVCRYQNAYVEGTLSGNLLTGENIQGTDTYCAL